MPRFCVPFCSSGERFGYLWVLDPDQSLSEQGQQLARQAGRDLQAILDRRHAARRAAESVLVEPHADVLFGGLAMTDGADGGLATGGLAGGLFGAPLGGTLSQPLHFGARSLASRDGLRRPTGGCFGSGVALDIDGGALFTVGGRCGGFAEVAM